MASPVDELGDSVHTSVIPGKVETSSILNLIFSVGCLLLGVRSPSLKKHWVDRVFLFLWTILLIAALYSVPREAYEFFSATPRPEGLCLTLIEVYYVVLSLTAFFTVVWVRVNRENIEPMLRKRGRGLSDVLLPLTVAAMELAWPIYSAFHNSRETTYRMSLRMVLKLTPLVSFLILMDLIAVVTHDQREILRSLREFNLNFHALTAKKWRIREVIRVANSTFAQIFLVTYIQSFILVIFVLGNAISGVLSGTTGVLASALLLSIMVLMIVLAKKCSSFYALCIETDQLLLEGIRSSKLCRSCHADLSSVLRFNEAWDTFKLGCFTHSSENFLKFLATGLTCVAISLQFDIRVIRALNALSSQPVR